MDQHSYSAVCPSNLLEYVLHISVSFAGCVQMLYAEALVAAAREIGLEVSADKTKYMVMSRDQSAGLINSQCED